MYILALDTTTPTASAAIWQDGALLGQYTIQTTTHSTTVLPMIESLLKNLSLTIPEIDLMTVAAGPGSFTGVRIGVSTIKGLAFSHQIPCMGVSSLEALAWNLVGYHGILCPVINARRGHVYTALFQANGNHAPMRLTQDDLLPISEVAEQLISRGETVYAAGDGYMMLREAMGDSPLLAETPEVLRYPSGFSAACAAAMQYQNAADPSIFTEAALAPIYLRKSQAEREREERLAKEQGSQVNAD